MNNGKLVFAQVMERLVFSICAIVKKNAVPSQRTLAHARLARVTTHRLEIHAQAPSPWSAPTRHLPTLADLCTQHANLMVAGDFCVVRSGCTITT
jgi:hypothetical protein